MIIKDNDINTLKHQLYFQLKLYLTKEIIKKYQTKESINYISSITTLNKFSQKSFMKKSWCFLNIQKVILLIKKLYK